MLEYILLLTFKYLVVKRMKFKTCLINKAIIELELNWKMTSLLNWIVGSLWKELL